MSPLRKACHLTLFAGAALIALRVGGAQAAGAIAFDQPTLQASAPLQVTIPDVRSDGVLPTNYTADGRNISPPLSWTSGPSTTRSYVLVMQDSDAPSPQPPVHWLVWAIPASVTSLPRGMHNVAEPTTPLGSAQGQNYHGSLGYSGPRPPVGAAPHHYHLQVFAIDRRVRTRPGSDLAAVERSMAGHVAARGELVVTYATAPPKTFKTPGSR